MHHTTRRHRPAIYFAAVMASLVLAGCGGSSGSSTSSSAPVASGAPAVAGATGTGPAGAGSGRFAALRTCLAKAGINLPARRAGTRPYGSGGPYAGGGIPGGGLPGSGLRRGLQPPAGMSQQQFQAALTKCGGGGFAGRRLANPGYRAALTKFATCMRQHGVNLPAPNTSGTGPVFNTSRLNTTTASFKAADVKCQPDLRGSFRGAGAGPGAGTTSAGAATQ